MQEEQLMKPLYMKNILHGEAKWCPLQDGACRCSMNQAFLEEHMAVPHACRAV